MFIFYRIKSEESFSVYMFDYYMNKQVAEKDFRCERGEIIVIVISFTSDIKVMKYREKYKMRFLERFKYL